MTIFISRKQQAIWKDCIRARAASARDKRSGIGIKVCFHSKSKTFLSTMRVLGSLRVNWLCRNVRQEEDRLTPPRAAENSMGQSVPKRGCKGRYQCWWRKNAECTKKRQANKLPKLCFWCLLKADVGKALSQIVQVFKLLEHVKKQVKIWTLIKIQVVCSSLQ